MLFGPIFSGVFVFEFVESKLASFGKFDHVSIQLSLDPGDEFFPH